VQADENDASHEHLDKISFDLTSGEEPLSDACVHCCHDNERCIDPRLPV